MSRWLMLSLGLIVGMAAGSAYLSINRAENFPEKVPTHWNINMEPDGFANRDDQFQVFWLMPVASIAVFALLCALPWLSPAHFKIDDFRRVYDYIVFLIVAMLTSIHGVVLYGQAHGQLSTRWFLGGFFLFFGLLGNVLGKVRKNFWVGVRTPWTLANDRVWNDTHRLAGRLFVGVGLLGVPLLFLPVPIESLFIIVITAIMAAAIIPAVYSAVHYKKLQAQGQI